MSSFQSKNYLSVQNARVTRSSRTVVLNLFWLGGPQKIIKWPWWTHKTANFTILGTQKEVMNCLIVYFSIDPGLRNYALEVSDTIFLNFKDVWGGGAKPFQETLLSDENKHSEKQIKKNDLLLLLLRLLSKGNRIGKKLTGYYSVTLTWNLIKLCLHEKNGKLEKNARELTKTTNKAF